MLALLGENGAGKSTLMKVLYGFYPPTPAPFSIDGSAGRFTSPRDAMAAGIGMVFQQFSLIPALIGAGKSARRAGPRRHGCSRAAARA